MELGNAASSYFHNGYAIKEEIKEENYDDIISLASELIERLEWLKNEIENKNVENLDILKLCLI